MKRLLIMLAAFALALAACSSSGGAQVATLDDAGSTTTAGEDSPSADQTDEEALLAFAACMRENGVENFQDPTVNADGSVDFQFRGGGQDGENPFGDTDRETVQAAFQACSDDLDGVALGPGGGDFDISEFQDTFVEFAACMRENGVQMDDPDFSGGFGPGQGGGGAGGGIFGDLDPDDPDVQAALEVCQGIFGNDLPGGGGPGGGPGGGGPGGGDGGNG